jgi:tripartite-type tricarboxylate transporter receptor subunit TctC
MLRVWIGFIVGYFFGTKGGREHYQELRAACVTIANSETFQTMVKSGSARLSSLQPQQLAKQGRAAIGSPQLVSMLTQRAVELAMSLRKAA